MPVLDALAARGSVGRAAVIPDGLPPGSDVGNMSIFGYDPVRYHTGRAPIEAAAIGLKLAEDQVAFRCNLVTVGADGKMVDFAGGHPDAGTAERIIGALDSELGGEVAFHAGVSYRHSMVAPAAWVGAVCEPPHDHTGGPAPTPTGPASASLVHLMEASKEVLSEFDSEANQIWLWGQGFQPQLPSFRECRGLDAGLVTAVDLIRGLGVLTGIPAVEVDGATGWYDTNYEGKRDAALQGLADGLDLFIIHVEASDEAGHAGDVVEKVRSLENWDRRILADLVSGLDLMGPWRMLLLPDHSTPLGLRTHTSDPVPYLIVDSEQRGSGGLYTEAGVADTPVVAGHDLMGELLGML
jgi:2,3-bisphosphoglycerate-independent phosphoglycerate mutase